MNRTAKRITVVVPCYNEQEVLPMTHPRLIEAMEAIGAPFELIYVNDGSSDRTFEIIEELVASDNRVRGLSLSRNFGHQMATTAGLSQSGGDVVVLIDADLQDPPEVIAQMYKRWQEGFDVAYGQRTDRQGESTFKLVTAKWFYRLLNKLSDVEIPMDVGDFRLMDRRVVDSLLRMPEVDRFLRGMVSWVGYKQIAVQYDRESRAAGESKYPIWKMMRFAADGILSFSMVPLRAATFMGLTVSALSVLGIIYAVFCRLAFDRDFWVPGWASLMIAILFIGGVQMILLGLMGEYIGRIYRESKGRPLYLLRDRIGFEPTSKDNDTTDDQHE